MLLGITVEYVSDQWCGSRTHNSSVLFSKSAPSKYLICCHKSNVMFDINRSEQILYFWLVQFIYIRKQIYRCSLLPTNLCRYNVQENSRCFEPPNMAMYGYCKMFLPIKKIWILNVLSCFLSWCTIITFKDHLHIIWYYNKYQATTFVIKKAT
jgi:hypothetical protein